MVSYCDHLVSISRHVSYVHNELPRNHWAKFAETSQKASSQLPLLNAVKTCGSMQNSGCHGNGKKNFKKIFSLESV